MEKAFLRKEVKERLKTLSNEDKLEYDNLIFENVKKSKLVKGNVFLYKALPSEVNTDLIIDYYIDKANLYLPIVKGDSLLAVRITKNTKYREGAFSILEPVGERIDPNDIDFDICITPLLSYDKKFNRLGKGKGFYDRFFSENECLKVGLAYSVQESEDVVVESHDKKLHYLINEKGIFKCE